MRKIEEYAIRKAKKEFTGVMREMRVRFLQMESKEEIADALAGIRQCFADEADFMDPSEEQFENFVNACAMLKKIEAMLRGKGGL